MKNRAIFALALFCFSLAASAAVTAVGTPDSSTGASTTPSTAHTVPSGTDVSYICISAGSDATISAMSNFGGVAPQLVGDLGPLHLYRVVNPSAGATTAQGTLSVSATWSIHVQDLDGADTADPDDTPVTGENSEQAEVDTGSITSATGDMVVACGYMVTDTIAAAAGSTLSTEEEAIDGSFTSSAMVYEAGAATVVVGVSSSATFGDNSIIGTNVNAAGGGGGSSGLLKRRRGN